MNRTDSRITSACSEPITLSTACAAVILPSSAIVVLLLRQSLRGDRRFEAPRWPTFFKTSPKALLHHFYRLDPHFLRRLDQGTGDAHQLSCFSPYMRNFD